jgi:hypothetical protein
MRDEMNLDHRNLFGASRTGGRLQTEPVDAAGEQQRHDDRCNQQPNEFGRGEPIRRLILQWLSRGHCGKLQLAHSDGSL